MRREIMSALLALSLSLSVASTAQAMDITQVKNNVMMVDPAIDPNYHVKTYEATTETGTKILFVYDGKSLFIQEGNQRVFEFPNKGNIPNGYLITEIATQNPNKKFWSVRALLGVRGADAGYWLIGQTKDGKIAPYISPKALANLGYDENSPHMFNVTINNNAITLTGEKEYHPAGDVRHLTKDFQVHTFWDDKAQWFGLQNGAAEQSQAKRQVKPIEDGRVDTKEKKLAFLHYKGDRNYLLYYACDGDLGYVVRSTLEVQKYAPPEYIIAIGVKWATTDEGKHDLEMDETDPPVMKRFLYNWDTRKMYIEETAKDGSKYWRYIYPRYELANAGDIAFYLAYHKVFYGENWKPVEAYSLYDE